MDALPLSIEPWILPIQNAITEAEAYFQEKAIKDAEAEAKQKGGRR